MPIRAIIFDMDACLSAADEVGEELFEPIFDAIRQANRGRLTDEELERAFDDMWRVALDKVAEEHNFSPEMRDAAWQVSMEAEVKRPMYGYGDLHVLRELDQQLFLVTSGFRLLQQSKVAALGIAPLFAEIRIDAIHDSDRIGKEGHIREILSAHQLPPEEVLIVGDNPDSEIAIGNKLGIRTVQTLRPRVTKSDAADHHIRHLSELKGIMEQV